jgi:hypothetical protein
MTVDHTLSATTFSCSFRVSGDYYKLVRYFIKSSCGGDNQVICEQPGCVLND